MANALPRVGFIGIGLMGHGMAKNIVTKGYPLAVLGHRNFSPVKSLLSLGATEAKSVRELAQGCDIVHLCVTGSPQVEALMLGNDGLLAHLSLLFVPVGVGVITHLSLVAQYGARMAAAIVLSTWAGLAVTALMLRALLPAVPPGAQDSDHAPDTPETPAALPPATEPR